MTPYLGFSTFVLLSALVGAAASWFAAFVRQDGWPVWINDAISTVMVLVASALSTLQNTSFSWNALWSAFFAAGVGFVLNHKLVFSINGFGQKIQTVTSFSTKPVVGDHFAPPPAPVPPVPAPPVVVNVAPPVPVGSLTRSSLMAAEPPHVSVHVDVASLSAHLASAINEFFLNAGVK